MTGDLFAINAINVARAAVREAESELPMDAPVEVTVGSRTNGYERLFIRASRRDGPAVEIDVDDAAVRACHEEDDHATCRKMVDELIDKLADEIRTAMNSALERGDDQ
ncbi:hypothetical protein D3I60_17300 [Brevibacterium permense]|uniref:hypothetical protein n=1 Tax=Brevibacterium permense TaxID=234834 RepID=UPI0021D21DFB|nr:hypothetical protein [Brevibacterium permense]MCU4298807.1 hypothetical protein [Brevibacterium permense]